MYQRYARVTRFVIRNPVIRADKVSFFVHISGWVNLQVVANRVLTMRQPTWHRRCSKDRLQRRIPMEAQENSIRLLTLSEVAVILKISKRTLHRMIQHRQIPAFKVGGQWRVLESRFQEWMRVEEQSAARPE
jgi:excisionase family DNA binding protein